jgi:hypothetical protein
MADFKSTGRSNDIVFNNAVFTILSNDIMKTATGVGWVQNDPASLEREHAMVSPTTAFPGATRANCERKRAKYL